MSEPSPESQRANVNVMLARPDSALPRTFPCPLCGSRLDVRESRAKKPYCVCNGCGVQVFIRGKTGIARLSEFLAREQPAAGPAAG